MRIRSHMVGFERSAHFSLGVALLLWAAFGDFSSRWALGFTIFFGGVFVVGGLLGH